MYGARTVSRTLIRSSIFERGTNMKYILIFSILAALLGGCVIAPAGYGDNRGDYYRERGYTRGDSNYRDRDYNRGYYRGGNQETPYRDHGS